MIKNSFRELPFFIIFLFYATVMTIEYGINVGMHLTILSVSFFILCTPAASILYFFHLLPFAIKEPISFFRATFIWVFLLVFNITTVFFKPSIFSKTLLTRFSYVGLTVKPINFILLSYSLSFLIAHWLITVFFKKNTYKLFLHISMIIISMSLFTLMIQLNYDTMVFYLVDMSYGNY